MAKFACNLHYDWYYVFLIDSIFQLSSSLLECNFNKSSCIFEPSLKYGSRFKGSLPERWKRHGVPLFLVGKSHLKSELKAP